MTRDKLKVDIASWNHEVSTKATLEEGQSFLTWLNDLRQQAEHDGWKEAVAACDKTVAELEDILDAWDEIFNDFLDMHDPENEECEFEREFTDKLHALTVEVEE